jgi:hypothetical protein
MYNNYVSKSEFILFNFLLQGVNGNRMCPNAGDCCSKWGFCGTTADHCGAGCQGGPCRSDVGMHNASFIYSALRPACWHYAVLAYCSLSVSVILVPYNVMPYLCSGSIQNFATNLLSFSIVLNLCRYRNTTEEPYLHSSDCSGGASTPHVY